MTTARRWHALLGLALAVAAASPAHAITRPAVPAKLEVGSGFRPYLRGHAVGTQNYTCTVNPTGPTGPPIGWAPYGPQATLFTDDDVQILTHYLSPNPDEEDTPRATWQHSRDSSTIWAKVVETSSDAAYVDADAIPWLLLEVTGWEPGPKNGRRLVRTRYVQRVNTIAGKAPATGCSEEADLGKRSLVPYETDYYFYARRGPAV
jgi:hypothetical protein